MTSCENAVAASPEHGYARDHRGWVRALTGDTQGAIDDFEYAIQWEKKGLHNKIFIARRQEWVDALKAGKNPFDAALLEQLKNE